MISTTKPKYDISNYMVGYTMEDVYSPTLGTEAKVFIPKLMTTINSSKPQILYTGIRTTELFCNDASCKPTIKPTLKTKNYITIKSDSSSDEWLALVKSDNNRYVLPKKSKVLCEFINNTFKEPIFTSDGYPSRICNEFEENASN